MEIFEHDRVLRFVIVIILHTVTMHCMIMKCLFHFHGIYDKIDFTKKIQIRENLHIFSLFAVVFLYVTGRFTSFAQLLLEDDFGLLSTFFEHFLSFCYYEIEHLSKKTCSNTV